MNTPDYCFLKSVFYSKTFLGGFCRNHGKEPPQHHKICDEQSSVCRKFFLAESVLLFLCSSPQKSTECNLSVALPFWKENEEKRYVPPPPLFFGWGVPPICQSQGLVSLFLCAAWCLQESGLGHWNLSASFFSCLVLGLAWKQRGNQ